MFHISPFQVDGDGFGDGALLELVRCLLDFELLERLEFGVPGQEG